MLIRAGGNHMDTQGLTRDVSVSLAGMPHDDAATFDVFEDGPGGTHGVPGVKLMKVAAWLTWGVVLERALERRVLPYVMVSSKRITVGGSLAGDGLSRFSPMVDKEAHHVLHLEVLLPRDGVERATLVHPEYYHSHLKPADALPEAENRDLFYAIIGGHGLIAVVLSVTYWVAELPPNWTDPRKIGVRSEVVRYEAYLDAFRDLDTGFRDIARGRRARFATDDGPRDYPMRADDLVALFGAGAINAWRFDPDRERFTIWRSTLVYGEDLRPFRGFNQDKHLRLLTFGLSTLPEGDLFIGRTVWNETKKGAAWPGEAMERPWVDDLEPYTFFFNAHRDAEDRLLKDIQGYRPGSLQQTFSIPADPDVAARFLAHVYQELRRNDHEKRHDLTPQVLDAMFLPSHETVLAPNPGHDAYAITLAFDGVRRHPPYLASLTAAMERISRHCLSVGGRVHLTKNLVMDDVTLSDMYGTQFERFRDIKKIADPNCVLRSDLWDRIERAMGW